MKTGFLLIFVITGIIILSTSHVFAQQPTTTNTININGTDYSILHSITGGNILGINANTTSKSIMIHMQSSESGTLTITLPRVMFDAMEDGEASHFIVLDNKHGANYKEVINTTNRTLTIPFPSGTNTITIIGTQIVPEYGTMTLLILTISVFSLLVISRFRTLSMLK